MKESIYLKLFDWGMYFTNSPEIEAVGFAFFESKLLQGFTDADDRPGVDRDCVLCMFGNASKDICCSEETGGFVKGDFLKVSQEQFFFGSIDLELFIRLSNGVDFFSIEIVSESLFVKFECLGIDMLHVKVMLIIDRGGFKTKKPAGTG